MHRSTRDAARDDNVETKAEKAKRTLLRNEECGTHVVCATACRSARPARQTIPGRRAR